MGFIFKRKSLDCPSCKKVGPLGLSKSSFGKHSFFEYSLPNSKHRHFICNNCYTVFNLSPVLEKIEYSQNVDIDFIQSFDFDLLQDSLYTRNNLLGINRVFEHFLDEFISDNTLEEDEQKEFEKLKEEFYYVNKYLQSIDDKEKIPRNLREEVMKAVGEAKSQSVMNYVERWNYENRLLYCSICESHEHDDEDCPLQY